VADDKQRHQRYLTYPVVLAGARWLAIAQAIILPIGTALPDFAWAILVPYGIAATLLSLPASSDTADTAAVLPRLRFIAVILLDIGAASAVGWFSGFSALVLIAALDAAAAPLANAVAALLASAVSYGLAVGLSHNGAELASQIGLAMACGGVAYAAAAYGLIARRRAERQIRAINRVLEAGSDLGTKLALPEVLAQLVNMLKQFQESVPWQNVVVYIASFDTETKEDILRAEALAGPHADFYRGSKLRFGEGVAGYSAMEQRPMLVVDLQKEPREAGLPKPKAAHGCMVVPIVSESQTIGCVAFTDSRPNAFTFEQQRLVDRLVRLASVGIQNALLHSKTLELAETDSMTGLLTNRAYQERLEAEFRKAQTARQSLALLIIDVDFFKRVNDTYGHPQGDELLRQLGELLRKHARRADICCRYGGDEFTIVMPETIKAEAAMVAGRIRQAVADKLFALDQAMVSITVSIGVAGYPQDVTQKAALVKAADIALYAAKQDGRNNVKLAGRAQTSQPASAAELYGRQ
jgi:diguanylate cyclase (GGDEF)-like protein